MTTNTITAGNTTSPGLVESGGNDGTLNVVVGPSGTPVTALAIDALGNVKSAALAAPAFSVYPNATQSLPAGTATKILLQSKEFDTASAFDNVTNYRFTPQVAGYYQVNGSLAHASSSETVAYVYKNGISTKNGGDFLNTSSATVAALVYLNGSTDYIELWCYSSVIVTTVAAPNSTYFQAFLARSA